MATYDEHASSEFLTVLREVLAVAAPAGAEHRMAEYVCGHLTRLGLKPYTDPLGNVSVRFVGSDADAPLVALASHMDEIAIVVTAIEADGKLRVAPSGGIRPEKLGEGPVEIVGDDEAQRVVGVVSFGSGHGGPAPAAAMQWHDVRIVTGLTPEDLARRGVRVGSAAVPTVARRGPVLFGDERNPLVAAWTFDNRAGVVALLRLAEAIVRKQVVPRHPLVLGFTVQEEGNCHGAKALAMRERPEVFVAVDGSPRPPGSPLTLDGRPCAWSKDSKGHSDRRLIAHLAAAARQAGTELQTAVYESAWSDASAVLDVGAAPRIVTFGHVRDSSHGFEVALLHGFDLVFETLKVFIGCSLNAAHHE